MRRAVLCHDSEMARSCPDCQTELHTEEVLGIALDVCPKCAGIWFDDGELLKLKELGDEAMGEAEDAAAPEGELTERTPSRRTCPECKAQLEEFSYLYSSKVKLDTCPLCFGTWVDDGELNAMRHALSHAELPESPELRRGVEHQLRVAELEAEHQDFLARHRRIAQFFRTLNMTRRRLPWVHL